MKLQIIIVLDALLNHRPGKATGYPESNCPIKSTGRKSSVTAREDPFKPFLLNLVFNETLFFKLLNLILFNIIVDLQCCVSFRYTEK